MNNLCPHCKKKLNTVYSITNRTEEDLNKYLDLRRCPACGKRLLYISTYSGAEADRIYSENHISLPPEDAAVLTRAFYKCPSPMDRNCNCPVHSTAEQFIKDAAPAERE